MTIFNTEYKSYKNWDISNWTLAQTSSGLSSTRRGGVYFNSNGTKIYLTQYGNGGRIYESSLQNPYDLSSIDFSKYMSLSYPEDIHFSTDGTKMFILKQDQSPFKLIRCTLSTAWDISTATNDQSLTTGASDLFRGLYITPDGKTIYMGGKDGNLYKYTLTTAWDLSTAGSLSSSLGAYGGICTWFGNSGKIFFNQTESSSNLNYKILSTPYDLSSVTTSGTLNVGQNRAGGIWFDDNGTMCVIVGGGTSTNYVTKYTM